MLPVVFVLLGLFGQQYHWLMTTPLQGSKNRTVLVEAYQFGVDYHVAKQLRDDAVNHTRDDGMFHRVWLWNGKRAAYQWRDEVEWRSKCWECLCDALDCEYYFFYRLHALERLYDLLGDEAYWAWAMPCPTPQYRVR